MVKKHTGVTVIIRQHDDKNSGHPHVIIDTVDDNYVSVGLSTTSKKGKNHPNIKLDNDPLGQGKESYMRRQGTVDSQKRYHNPKRGVMSEKDFAKAKKIGEKAKKKYLRKK